MNTAMSMRGQWESFERGVLNKAEGVGTVQRLETRRAFYAGMGAMLVLVASTADVSEDEGVRRMQAWHAELQGWLDLLRSGAV